MAEQVITQAPPGVGQRTFWSAPLSSAAIVVGVFVALSMQVLATLLGMGLGLATISLPTIGTETVTVSWMAFVWWALSGILSAFVGGFAAGYWADSADTPSGWLHGLLTWCAATVIVVAFVGIAVGGNATVMANLGDPVAAIARQAETIERLTPEAQARAESTRRIVAYVSLASFGALLAGAVAGAVGGGAAQGMRRLSHIAS